MAQEEILLIWSGETQLDSTTEVCRRLALLKVDRVNYYEIVPFVYWVLIVPERTPPCQVSKFLQFQTLLGHFFYLEARTSPSTALCLRHIARSECRSQFLAEDWHFCYSRIFKACSHLCHMPGYDEHDKYNLITALDLHYRKNSAQVVTETRDSDVMKSVLGVPNRNWIQGRTWQECPA